MHRRNQRAFELQMLLCQCPGLVETNAANDPGIVYTRSVTRMKVIEGGVIKGKGYYRVELGQRLSTQLTIPA